LVETRSHDQPTEHTNTQQDITYPTDKQTEDGLRAQNHHHHRGGNQQNRLQTPHPAPPPECEERGRIYNDGEGRGRGGNQWDRGHDTNGTVSMPHKHTRIGWGPHGRNKMDFGLAARRVFFFFFYFLLFSFLCKTKNQACLLWERLQVRNLTYFSFWCFLNCFLCLFFLFHFINWCFISPFNFCLGGGYLLSDFVVDIYFRGYRSRLMSTLL